MTDEDKAGFLSIEERIVKVKELIADCETKSAGSFAYKFSAISLKGHLNDLYEIREKQGEHE